MGWFEFILDRYNYWIVIVLMMTGLYIVFARGNLVKKVVGLNLFQTSVFIFYITIGKIAGGTAPIYIGGELDHGDGHGGGDGEGHGAAEGHGDLEITTHGQGDPLPPAMDDGMVHTPPETLDAIDTPGANHLKTDNISFSNDLKAGVNELKSASVDTDPATESSLHTAPDGADKIANDTLLNLDKPTAPGFEVEGEAAGHGADAANSIADAVHHTSEVIYTNPLPHVLILTAIVVGVATTAVGLALAVRIREAYGTIEEDELETMDNVAEFGDVASARAV